MDSIGVIVSWYFVTTLASIAFTPLALLLFRRFTDRGASFARTFAMLVFVWPAWFLSGMIPGIVRFTEVALWATLVIGGVASWVLAIQIRAIDREALTHVGLGEVAHLILFAAYIWFRGFNPTIQNQEKLSDLMMLASTMRAESMPPNDAWLAGETINYYYVGYVPWAAIGKLIETTPAIAYNLALASVFACTVMAAAGVAANVAGRFYSLTLARVAGALGGLLVIVMATPWSMFTAIERRDTIWDAFWFDFMWAATRQLGAGNLEAITEFPAFSFQLGDLHPHLLALPYTILALGMAWMLAILPRPGESGSIGRQWWRIAIAGGTVGALYAMNSWDYPAYLLLALGGLAAGTAGWPARQRLAAALLLLGSSVIAWIPFYVNFESPTASANTPFADAAIDIPVVGGILGSVAGWTGEKTTPWEYLGLLGFPYAIAMCLIGWEMWRRRDFPSDPALTRIVLGAAALFGIVGLLAPMPLLILAGIPIALILLLWHRDREVSAANVALALAAMGLTLTLIPEFIYLIDIFNSRMNIVFKLYYQAWTMLALGAAIGLAVLLNAARSLPVARIAVAAMVVLIVVGGAIPAAIGGRQWISWRTGGEETWIGIDGLHFLEAEAGWAGEHQAIEWLYANAELDDVMLSAGGCEFTLDVGTTASGSGVPTILGWEGHEWQWHLGQPSFREGIRERIVDINAMWASLDPVLLDRYSVTLLYVGPLELDGGPYRSERASETCAPGPFPNASDPDFPGAGWTEVYRNDDGVRIYRRDGT